MKHPGTDKNKSPVTEKYQETFQMNKKRALTDAKTGKTLTLELSDKEL